MTIWQPSPGEVLLARTPIMFATGAATPVAGMRWFRDTERNDIQHELAGWPEGPTYTVRSKADRRARAVAGGALRTLGVLAMAVLTGGGGVGSFSTLGRPQDPANEVEDFPVLWGAPGSLAQTLPWQLDPARRADNQRTHLIVTDQRIVIVGLLKVGVIDDEVLWEVGRGQLARVEPKEFSATKCKDFSAHQCDVRVDFTDGSWCRLASNYRDEVCEHLTYPLELVSPEDLTPGQRRRVDAFTAGKTVIDGPMVTRLPDFNYLIQIRESEEVSVFSGITFVTDVMDRDGEDPD
ncbi:hypothetical protein [Streptomyces sp. NPDC005336]|uniref:hypothetical protein n=1 Tax=Streptomyces sp. NPDC005336 TaxID=3157035 RepID=UPI0033A692FF